MTSLERLTLTGLPNESLDGRFYPDNPESPTYGHLQALKSVANGYLIDDEVKQAVMEVALRYGDNLDRVIDNWNRQVVKAPDIVADQGFREVSFQIMRDAIVLSFGSSAADPEERNRLIMGAIQLLNTDISPN